MGFLKYSGACVLLLALCTEQIICAPKDSSINQQISQDVNGPTNGCINQVISQDVENGQSCAKSGSVNQNINQDVVNTCGGNAESINQKIHQKVKHGSTCIDQKTFHAIKNHEKRSSKPCCGKEIIFKRRHNNGGCNCGDIDSSEEIKICDAKHSSEIIYKNHADRCGDISEDSSEEIRIKYADCNKCKRKPCECQTNEDILMPKPCCIPIPVVKPCKSQYSYCPCAESKHYDSSEEVVVYKPHKTHKSCEDSSEEIITIKTKTPCNTKKACSSEEHTYPYFPKPCQQQKPCKSSEEYVKCFKPKPCDSSEESRPKPCQRKPCDSSEEMPRPKLCPCAQKPCLCKAKPWFHSSEERKPCSSEERKPCSSEETVVRPCPRPFIRKPCSCERVYKPKPCSEEKPCFKPVPCFKPKPCSSEEVAKPRPCGCNKSSEEARPWRPCDSWKSSSNHESKVVPCARRW